VLDNVFCRRIEAFSMSLVTASSPICRSKDVDLLWEGVRNLRWSSLSDVSPTAVATEVSFPRRSTILLHQAHHSIVLISRPGGSEVSSYLGGLANSP